MNTGVAQAIGQGILGNGTTLAQTKQAAYPRATMKTVFSGRVEVEQVTNGYVVKIASKEGMTYDCYIAKDVKEVNELITAAVVTFRLENT